MRVWSGAAEATIEGGVHAMQDGETEYFATFGPTTDIDGHAERIALLPRDAAALGEIVRGLLIHNWTAEMNGIIVT